MDAIFEPSKEIARADSLDGINEEIPVLAVYGASAFF
jgi:hypothetical protein